MQIADALEEAHRKGIVHRDLKPANVKLDDSGRVKVLDFGIAKPWRVPTTRTPRASVEPTTSPGTLLGTAPYMSPEQARGLPVDPRTDLWAFGCLLYEMLTGRRAFPGTSVPTCWPRCCATSRTGRRCPRTRRAACDACSGAACARIRATASRMRATRASS